MSLRHCGLPARAAAAIAAPLCALGAAVLLLALPGAAAAADTLVRQPSPAVGQAAATAATTRSPDAVRVVLRALHGFTRAALDAASTDVPAILQALIDDPAEPLLLRRQAVKALRLYPSEATLTFIDARVDGAPLGLRRLYLGALSGFGPVGADRVGAILARALADGDPTVRHAAVATATTLAGLAPVRATLERHLDAEPDPAIRDAIRQALGTR